MCLPCLHAGLFFLVFSLDVVSPISAACFPYLCPVSSLPAALIILYLQLTLFWPSWAHSRCPAMYVQEMWGSPFRGLVGRRTGGESRVKVPNKPSLNYTRCDSTEVSTDSLGSPSYCDLTGKSTNSRNSPSPWPSPSPLFLFLLRSHAWGWLGAMVGNSRGGSICDPQFWL